MVKMENLEESDPQSESPDRKPERKKLKTSITSEESSLSASPAAGSRKLAIVLAFCSFGYEGVQKNPGAKTIEGDLEEALNLSGAVVEADRNKPRQYEWEQSARIDEGASAIRQVVSGRFNVLSRDSPGFVARINKFLHPQIRVFGFKHVEPSFSSKKCCDRQRYVYLLPMFALDPCSHREAETVRSESGYEYVKCVECFEKGYKIPLGLLGKDTSGNSAKSSEFHSDISSNNCDAFKFETLRYEYCPVEFDLSSEKMWEAKKFLFDEGAKIRLERIISNFVGSHKFHNFTTRTKAADPYPNRYIVSFTANKLIKIRGKHFVKFEVVGRSFMLDQIRKMIGLVVAVMRNHADESMIQTAFKKDVRINVPLAPEVGLCLDECFFASYNKRSKDRHDAVTMEEYGKEAEKFKDKLYSCIGSAEEKDGAVAIWLHSLKQIEAAEELSIVDKVNDETSKDKIVEETIAKEENATG